MLASARQRGHYALMAGRADIQRQATLIVREEMTRMLGYLRTEGVSSEEAIQAAFDLNDALKDMDEAARREYGDKRAIDLLIRASFVLADEGV